MASTECFALSSAGTRRLNWSGTRSRGGRPPCATTAEGRAQLVQRERWRRLLLLRSDTAALVGAADDNIALALVLKYEERASLNNKKRLRLTFGLVSNLTSAAASTLVAVDSSCCSPLICRSSSYPRRLLSGWLDRSVRSAGACSSRRVPTRS